MDERKHETMTKRIVLWDIKAPCCSLWAALRLAGVYGKEKNTQKKLEMNVSKPA